MPKVRFDRSGIEVEWDPSFESLLKFGEANGVYVDHCCVSGIDGVCTTRLLSGEVEYTYEVSYDVEPHHVLVCIAVPKTDVVLDA